MIKSFFIEGLGTSNNKFVGMHSAVIGKYKAEASDRVLKAIKSFDLTTSDKQVFISYFPVVGGNEEKCFEGVKISGQTRKKYTGKKNGYDADNVTIYTKMIQDKLKNTGIIKEDNQASLKGVYFHTYHKDRLLTSGFIIVIEEIEDNDLPDLKQHLKEFKRRLKEQEVLHK